MTEKKELIWAEIKHKALANNIRELSSASAPASLMAIVKADAYGHGMLEVAETAIKNGAASLGVGRAEEGLKLRLAGFKTPVLVFGHSSFYELKEIIKQELEFSISSMEEAKKLSHAASLAKKDIRVHVKIDTGMQRLGFTEEDLLFPEKLFSEISNLKGLKIKGIYTHFARADEREEEASLKQLALFKELILKLKKAKLCPPLIHAANSAALMRFPESHFNAVRPGIGIYGISPSDYIDSEKLKLQPALELKTRIVQIKTIKKASSLSYGHSWTAPEDSLIATIACGYGDGFSRAFSNNCEVIVKGKRAPLRGRVCMDLSMIDISHIPDVKTGDIVTIIGKEGKEEILAEELAEKTGTIAYEIVTSLMPRIKRIHLYN